MDTLNTELTFQGQEIYLANMKLSLSIYGYKQPGDTLLNQAGFLTSVLSLANYVLLKLVHLQCFADWSLFSASVSELR